MSTLRTWLAAVLVAAVGVYAACGETPTQAPDISPAVSPDGVAEDGAATTPTAPGPAFEIGTQQLNNCIGDMAVLAGIAGGVTDPYDLNCTANDTRIGFVDLLGGGPITCVEDQPVTLDLQAELVANAKTRYDVGVWLATDGGDAISGECEWRYLAAPLSATATPTVPKFPCGPDLDADGTPDDECDGTRTSPYWNAEATTQPDDACGDMEQNIQNLLPFGVITLTCQDSNDDGFLDANGCIAYHNSADTEPLCTAANADLATTPETKSKCRCDPLTIPVNVLRQATVTVVKKLVPNGNLTPDTGDDPGTFDLEIREYDNSTVAASATAVTDGGSASATIQWFRDDEPTENKAFVEETGANLGSLNEGSTPSAFAFYTTTYECKDEGGTGSVVASGSGTGGPSGIELSGLQNGDDIVCMFTNTRIPAPDMTVDKTVNTSFDRNWTWTITKQAFDQLAIEIPTGTTKTLQIDEIYVVDYKVTVSTQSTDSNWQVSGNITISAAASTAPYVGTVLESEVLDAVNGADATVDCPAASNTLNPGGSITCTYSYTFGSEPTGSEQNKATATVTWNTGDTETDDSGFKNITFGAPTNETNEMATVTDDKGGATEITLGTLTRQGGMFTYTNPMPACAPPGDNRLNTATVTPNDGGPIDQAMHALSTACAFPGGCVLTQGYWKTHSQFGPAPYDAGWEAVGGAGTEFDSSGEAYYDVLWNSGKGGNMWYKLAHQWIAAELNTVAGGSDDSCVAGDFADAEALLVFYAAGGPGPGPSNTIPKKNSHWCDTQPATSACKSYNTDRQYAVYLNNRLTAYNEGYLCAEHCDDDGLTIIYGGDQ